MDTNNQSMQAAAAQDYKEVETQTQGPAAQQYREDRGLKTTAATTAAADVLPFRTLLPEALTPFPQGLFRI